MKHHFNKFGWPSTKDQEAPEADDAKDQLVDELQVQFAVQWNLGRV
jgi:hypothetical protein